MSDESTPPPNTPAPPFAESTGAQQLPIYNHVQEIVDTIRSHRAVVVEGPTGSGKTTQLPRILLAAGLVPGRIGVTQPRRIAATSVARRIAEEEGVELGQEVGYAIRFDDCTNPNTVVKVMTDGILLMEARTDPDFSAYDIVMVDEAHERTLNIDFTLGLLHRALTRRDDLRVIVSSATLDPVVFQRYFADVVGEVPILSIAARTYPVRIAHYPPESTRMGAVIETAAAEIVRIHRSGKPGHILVFMSGEAMIRGTEEEIRRHHPGRDLMILPLYSRLTREEQERVFCDFGSKRKVILSTNIAETSITIPDVRFVVDTGLAKVPRVQVRTGITTLREEGISRASADQRSGRAGRTAPGEAIRLYSARDLSQRPQFTDEEISRLDLSDVFLRLIDHGIKRVETFPFPTRPPAAKARAALRKLLSLGAIDHEQQLTHVGRRMVPFPLSPELARMVIEAVDHFPDVVDDVLIVGAFLSGRRPYLFPPNEEHEARAAHRHLAHPLGDAPTDILTYRGWIRSGDPDGYCTRNYLDPDTMAFIHKTHQQLQEIAEKLQIEVRSGGPPMSVNRAVASGLPDQLLMARGRTLVGPGDVKVSIHPSSSLFGSHNRFLVAGELVVSSRTYARWVSVVKPEWICDLNPELASQWRIRPDKIKRDHREEAADLPDELTVRGVKLPVSVRRGEPRVDIPIEVVEQLKGATVADLPTGAAAWSSRISSGRHRFAQGLPLGALLELLPVLPLPAPGATLPRDIPDGALLEIDRNLHTLERYLGRLLEPCLPERGKRPGWVTLVANGEGVYWYEVDTHFPEAVASTIEALRDLAQGLDVDDDLQERLGELLSGFEELRDTVTEVLGRRPDRGSGRGRRRSRRRR